MLRAIYVISVYSCSVLHYNKIPNVFRKVGYMKKASMRSLLILFVLILSFSTPANAAKVKLNKKSLTLTVGKTYKLKVKGTKKKVKWSSSNKKVASVNKKGKVTAKKAGKVTITAKIGKKKYKCKVTVNAVRKIIPDVFNESIAANSVIFLEEYNINDSIWIKVKNNYSKPADLFFDFIFYKNGAVVEKNTDSLTPLKNGHSSWVGCCYGNTVFDDYRVSIHASDPYDMADMSDYLQVTASNASNSEMFVTVKNNSNREILYSRAFVFYYNHGSLVSIDAAYTNSNIGAHSSEILEGMLPYNAKTFDYLPYTNYKIEVYACS